MYRDGISISGVTSRIGNSIKSVYTTVFDWGRSVVNFFFPHTLRPQKETQKD